MKTLLILRHGKSSWASQTTPDHDRPLKARGDRDARRIGVEIKARGLTPDLILSSTALRAKTTAALAAETAGYAATIVETRELYLSTVLQQLEVVARDAGGADRVMLVGHNPTSEDLVEHLTGNDVRMTTANLACIDLEIASWGELTEAYGELRCLLRPKELAPVEAG